MRKFIKYTLLVCSISLFGISAATCVNSQLRTSLQCVAEKETIFADLWTITYGAETYAQGIDPMVKNPCEPLGRPLNYPRIWQTLFLLGIDRTYSIPLGLCVIASFLLGLSLFWPSDNQTHNSYMILAIFSPAILLGIKRANLDLLMFLLLVVSIKVVKKNAVVSFFILMIGFFLKLFPVFGCSFLLLQNRSKFYKVLLGILSVSCIYLTVTFSDVRLIMQNTPQECGWSYGFNVLWMSLGHMSEQLGRIAWMISVAVVIVVFVFSFSALLKKQDTEIMQSERYIDEFRVGAAIFVGTFLLGNNFDYRLVFLLLTMPQLRVWIRSHDRRISGLAKGMLVLIVIALWSVGADRFSDYIPLNVYFLYAVGELPNWLLMAGLTYLFLWSTPEWFKLLVSTPILRKKSLPI